MVCYGGGGALRVCYGVVTEPLPTGTPVVAVVDEGDLDDLYRAGKAVWNAQYLTHVPVTMVARRREG